MSYHGKKFKKTKLENMEEFMDIINVPEKIRVLFRGMDNTSTFNKNDDGSIQYIVSKGDTALHSQKLIPGVDSEFTTPDGQKAKIQITINGDVVESVITMPDGNKLNLNRVFEGNTMKLIVSKDGVDIKGVIYYETV